MPATSDNVRTATTAVDMPVADRDIAEILFDRGIAVGQTPAGEVVLTRPGSALVRVPADREGRQRLAELAARFDPTNARTLKGPKLSGTVATIKLGAERELRTERRWVISRANQFLDEARQITPAEYNHVVIGSQVVIGSPLGAVASWAGDMAFVGKVHRSSSTGRPTLLSSAIPAAEPDGWPAPLAIPGRPRPRVLVLDTGLRTTEARAGARGTTSVTRRAEHSRLAACGVYADWRIDPTPGFVDDEDEEFDEPPFVTTAASGDDKLLDFEAGHGTFIAGVILRHCPDADIVSAGVLSSFGDGDVAGVLSTLERMNAEQGPFDLVVMSFGTNLADDEAGLFGEELTRLLGDAVGVAAAGNQATSRPYFPAALPNVIGVGALAADGKAWFTNFGGWVDACAPGVDVVSTFFENFDEVLDGETTREYRGWARWSGTSFSAPKVAAAIAQEQYLFGGTARDAWKRLTSHKHFRYPDLGHVFNL